MSDLLNNFDGDIGAIRVGEIATYAAMWLYVVGVPIAVVILAMTR